MVKKLPINYGYSYFNRIVKKGGLKTNTVPYPNKILFGLLTGSKLNPRATPISDTKSTTACT